MSDLDSLDERLRAVERALTDSDDSDLTDLRNAAELTRDLETLATRLDDVEKRLDELDAATQALRGYVGNVRAVNESVERRADAALAKAETLESEALEAGGGATEPVEARDRTTNEPATNCPATRFTATESGTTAPCGCRLRRPRAENDADEGDAPPESDRGLLARIVEAL